VYSYNFPRDSRRIKLLGTRISRLIPTRFSLTKDFVVYSIFFLETVQTALSGADLYYWFAAGFDKERLVAPFASPFDLQILEPVVSLSVQFFFVYRVRVLSRLSEKQSRWLWVIICLVTSSPKAPERPFYPSRSSPLSAD
jgi:hypothetical protein